MSEDKKFTVVVADATTEDRENRMLPDVHFTMPLPPHLVARPVEDPKIVSRTLGPDCPRCPAGNPRWVTVVRDLGADAYGTPAREQMTIHHDCPREPRHVVTYLLERIGGWTNARWDQHARNEFGDVATNEAIVWLEKQGIRPYRGGP